MFDQDLISFFVDPLLRDATIGSMLISFVLSLVGVILYLKKQSLVGEMLSHACYPGMVIGILLMPILFRGEVSDPMVMLMTFFGASLFAFLSMGFVHFLKSRLAVKEDTALCLTLSSFFGMGLLFVHELQLDQPLLYRQVMGYLYGQAALLDDVYVMLFAFLALVVSLVIIFFFKEIQLVTFDRLYAKNLGVSVRKIELLLAFLVIVAVIVGVRAVGVVLMSAMLIAPPVAARQLTNKLSFVFIFSGLIGLASGFFGNYLAVSMTNYFQNSSEGVKIVFPTGPMIVLFASAITSLCLIVAPARKGSVRKKTSAVRGGSDAS